MLYTLSGPSSETTVQFFLTPTPDETELWGYYKDDDDVSYSDFESMVSTRVFKTLQNVSDKEISADLKQSNIAVRCGGPMFVVVVRFEDVRNVDSTGKDTDSVFTQIKHGAGFADLKIIDAVTNEDTVWTMWSYLGSCMKTWENGQSSIITVTWPPPADIYEPFIRPDDYRVFIANDDDLSRCLEAFRKDMPDFLRSQWREGFDKDIEAIEKSDIVLDVFNCSIDYPSYTGAAILDDLFTCVDEEEIEMLSDDTFTILNYFYHICI